MQIHGIERDFIDNSKLHHHHPGNPEKQDVLTGDQGRGREIFAKLGRLFRPAQCTNRPKARRKPGVQNIRVTPKRYDTFIQISLIVNQSYRFIFIFHFLTIKHIVRMLIQQKLSSMRIKNFSGFTWRCLANFNCGIPVWNPCCVTFIRPNQLSCIENTL